MFQSPLPGAQGVNIVFCRQGQVWGGSGCLFSWEQVGEHSMNQTPCGSLMPELRMSSAGCWRAGWVRAEQSTPARRTPGRCLHPSSHVVDGRQRRLGESEWLVPRPSVPPIPSLSTPCPLSWLLLSGPRPPQAPCIPPSPRPGSGLAFPCPGMSTALRQVPVRLGRPRTGDECAFSPAGLPALTAPLPALAQQGPRPFALGCWVAVVAGSQARLLWVQAAPGASLWIPSSHPSSEGSGGPVSFQPQPPSYPLHLLPSGMGRESNGVPLCPHEKILCERGQEVGEANLEGVVQCINPALRASHLVGPGGADPGRSRQGSSCMAAYDFMAGRAGGLWAGGHLARP